MRRYLIFVTAGIGLLMYSIDSTAVAVAFHDLIRDLHTNVLWAGWTMSIFFVGVTTMMPLAGKLSDTFGRKGVFLASLVLFVGSSLACGLAPNIYVLVAWRFFQGVGGASFLPTASGIVSDHFPQARQSAIGLFTSIFPIGGIIGPNVGAWIVSRFSWRYIFYINLPIGLVLIALVLVLLKGSGTLSRRRIDFSGSFLLSGSILLFMFGLNIIVNDSRKLPLLLFTAFVLSGIFLAILFLRHEKKEADPILDLALLRSRPFLAANLLNLMLGAGFFGLLSFVPLYAVSVHGLSTLMSGMVLTPRSLGVIFTSIITSFALKRSGYRRPLVLGLTSVSLATILLIPGLPIWRIMGGRSGATETLAFLVLILGMGIGITNPAANNACIELMPKRVATIVGLRGMFRSVGGVVSICLITSILHLSGSPVTGFTITFLFYGTLLACGIPLAFLVPSGRLVDLASGSDEA
jgi:EmrB/QacA subfamily drug resistance transporter